jgi:hypothetical protein
MEVSDMDCKKSVLVIEYIIAQQSERHEMMKNIRSMI